MKVDSVDTRHGTLNKPAFSNGNTLPYTGVPFGMNYFCVQNQDKTNWYFDPTYPLFQGIRMTHQPSPWMGDYSWLVLTPLTGKPLSKDLSMLQSSYKLDKAEFKPHKTVIDSLRYRLKTTVVPTKRGAQFTIARRSDKPVGFLLTTENETEYEWKEEAKQIRGVIDQPVNEGKNTLKQYVVLDLSDPSIEGVTLSKGENGDWVEKENATDTCVWVTLKTKSDRITVTLATSFISMEQAQINFDRELKGKRIEELETESAEKWQELLNKIEVSDADQSKVNLFYQHMYRMFLFPQTYYEIDRDGNSLHFDSYSESVKPGKLFTNNGFWDTYRTVYPLFSIILPDHYKDILEGIKHVYTESKHLPKWLSPDERGLMPGTLINAVIADASVKGLLSEEDSQFFLDAMIKEATTEPKERKFGRAGVAEMKEYGYVTNKEVENVNQTQDNAYSDFCIRQVAKTLVHDEIAEKYTQEAFNYQKLFDRSTGFLRGRDAEGNFSDFFVPEDWGFDYTEGSAWQNALAFYHDNQGYIDLLGGEDKFLAHLTKLANERPVFEIGNYGMEIHEMSEMSTNDFGQIAMSNQPSFHIPYLYVYAGRPEYTQHIVKQLYTYAFSDGFEGYPGDEDNGSMSGWAIFSALGFYPVTPGTNEYVLGIPQFDEIVIQLPHSDTFKINVEGNLPQNSFVQQVELNGRAHNDLYLKHEDIINGGEMHTTLSLLPSLKSYKAENYPFSLSRELN